MKNIIKLIQNSDFSSEMQTKVYDRIANTSDAIEVSKKHYVECKERFMAADANLNKAIAGDDYEAKLVAAQEIIQIVNDLHETRERIKQLTIKNQSFYNSLMMHQKSDEHIDGDEHIYVLPRQQVFEFLKALDEGVKANPDFKSLKLAIASSFLKK